MVYFNIGTGIISYGNIPHKLLDDMLISKLFPSILHFLEKSNSSCSPFLKNYILKIKISHSIDTPYKIPVAI